MAREPYRDLAARFNMTSSSIHRHAMDHMQAIVQRNEDKTAMTAKGVILELVDDLRTMARECRDSGVGKDFLLVADRLTRASEVYGKLTGEISPNTNNLFISLGVRSEDELRGKLDMVKALESGSTPEESFQDFVQMGRLLLADHPELRHSLAVELGLDSYAEVVEPGGERESGETPDAMTRPAHTNGGANGQPE